MVLTLVVGNFGKPRKMPSYALHHMLQSNEIRNMNEIISFST